MKACLHLIVLALGSPEHVEGVPKEGPAPRAGQVGSWGDPQGGVPVSEDEAEKAEDQSLGEVCEDETKEGEDEVGEGSGPGGREGG